MKMLQRVHRGWKCLLASVLLLCMVLPQVTVLAKDSGSADWMGALSGETKLSAISIPGTHDTCTQFVALSYIFQCQDKSVAGQLDDGYRYFDLRLVVDEKDDKPALVIKHNFASCRKGKSPFSDKLYLEDVLADVSAFLAEHPTETVILCMKAENGDDSIADVQRLLYEQIEKNESQWYLQNAIPTLDEVRGKMVLATRFADELGVGPTRKGLNFDWRDQGDTTVVDEPYALSMINEGEKLWVQDRYNYDTTDKVNAIVDDLENCQAADDSFSLNFTSTSGSGKVGHPKKYATSINKFLTEYDWQDDTCYGIIVVDFATEKLAKCIYETNAR
ncbi:MAG: phosphatidylinositol-specific phospholipase C [Lachnospiraceae bacterium]|nr:phosphatidylinositol-specific phospholipase C [Lachnospiraceae bacterium]